MDESERRRWIAEVQVLKAFYHYYLLQLYGPIPIVDENLPISATEEEVRIKRDKVDEVIEYIVNSIDEVYMDLPLRITNQSTEMGRLTRPAALAIKAKVLLLAASPLFNGNTDYANFKDWDGEPFFLRLMMQINGYWLLMPVKRHWKLQWRLDISYMISVMKL